MRVSFKSVILREPHDVQSWLTFVHSVQSVHTMAIHPNTQVGSKLLLCSAGRGTCHLQAKLSKLQRHHNTQAKTTSKLLLSWTTAEIFTSAKQKVHTCSFLHTHTTIYKNKFLCLHIKNCQNLRQYRGRSLKESTFYWETQMGGCFKTKQTALLLTQPLLSEQNCTALQLRHNMWDSSSPSMWKKSLHPVCHLWKAMLAGVSASGWKTCCQRSNNSHKEKKLFPSTSSKEEKMVRYKLL